MSRKDYVVIADMISVERDQFDSASLRTLQRKLADYFQTDNPNFDRAKFDAACAPKRVRHFYENGPDAA
jgi:hypothetical protein